MTSTIGILAAAFTTLCWAPQLHRTFGRGTASDFAWPYLAMLGAGQAAWSAYGALEANAVILASNLLALLFVLAIASVKIRSRLVVVQGVEWAIPAGTDPEEAIESLEGLAGIGPALATDLRSVGIGDVGTLRALGTEEANRRLVASGLQTGTMSRRAIAEALASGSPATHPPEGRAGLEGDLTGNWGTITGTGEVPVLGSGTGTGEGVGATGAAPGAPEDREDPDAEAEGAAGQVKKSTSPKRPGHPGTPPG